MENVENINKVKGNVPIEESIKNIGYRLRTHESLAAVKRIYTDEDNELFFVQKTGLRNWVNSIVKDFNPPVSKALVPQNALINVNKKKIVIVEYFSQTTTGSLDTKLVACDFKRKHYVKQFSRLDYSIDYVVVLNEWFTDASYKDWIDYIVASGCRIYFTELKIGEVF